MYKGVWVMNIKKVMFRLWAIFLCLAFVIGVAELFLQIQKYRKYKIMVHNRYGFFEADPFLQIRPKQYPELDRDLHVNSNSFRGDPVSQDPQTYRIFALGGSTTYMTFLPYNKTYPARLEEKLKAQYPGKSIQVQNAACDWYSSEHLAIRYLFNVKYLKPNLIIIKIAINDLFRSFAPEWWCRPKDNYRRDYSHYLGPVVGLEQVRTKYFPFTEFLLYKKIKGIFSSPFDAWLMDMDVLDADLDAKIKKFTKPAAVREFKSLEAFEENLRMLVKLLKNDFVKVILATEPSIYRQGLSLEEKKKLYFGLVHCSQRGFYADTESMEYGMHLYNEVILKVAKEMSVAVVDVDKAIPKSGEYFFDDVHLKDKATEIESQLIVEKIRDLGLLDK